MKRKLSNEQWNEVIDLFSSYEGTVSKFCEDNNVSKTQFYYHKRRIEASNNKSTPVFQGISLNEKDSINKSEITYPEIRIEIGMANIFIPANEIAILSNIIKELSKSC